MDQQRVRMKVQVRVGGWEEGACGGTWIAQRITTDAPQSFFKSSHMLKIC